ncbi:MAG: phospho-N-acetylmuramoyl-pentapeptide-transferase [bacterium]
MYILLVAGILISFILTFFLYPPFITKAKKWVPKRIQQNIRPNVYQLHQKKEGTPNLGGLLILVAISLLVPLLAASTNTYILLAAAWSFGLLGLLDDILGTKGKTFFGLTPLMKLFFQCTLALLTSLLCFFIGQSNELSISLVGLHLNNPLIIIPFFVLLYVSTTNAVNITDGLDQLAGSLLAWCYLFFTIIAILQQRSDIASFTCVILGSLFAFLWYNRHPARIFMGDTGSMSHGALITTLAILLKMPLILLVLGLPFIIETGSVILQRIWKKVFGRRIFLLSPLHHHFEKKGYSEQKIVLGFTIFGFICFCISLLLAAVA